MSAWTDTVDTWYTQEKKLSMSTSCSISLVFTLYYKLYCLGKYNIFSYKSTLNCLFTSGQSEQQCYSSVYGRTSECWLLRCPSGKFASVQHWIFDADINPEHLRLHLPLNHHLLNCDAYCSTLLAPFKLCINRHLEKSDHK